MMRVFSGAGPNELKVSAFLEERDFEESDALRNSASLATLTVPSGFTPKSLL